MSCRHATVRHLGAALATSIALVCTAATGAGAAEPVTPADATGTRVSITQVDTSRFPVVRAAFGADEASGKTPDLTFFEDGQRIDGANFYRGNIGTFEDERHADLMLVLDASFSMQGGRIDDAVAAAKELIAQARPEDRIGLATFGITSTVVEKPTTDHGKVLKALDGIELTNATNMFDAVTKSAKAFDGDAEARRAIVVLSDGTDLGSTNSVEDAAAAARTADAPIFAIAIRDDVNDQPKDLALLGNGTGGEVRTVVGTEGLDDLFGELGRRLLQPYWIEYRSTAPDRSQVTLGIGIGDTIDARRTFRAVLPVASGSKPSPLVRPRSAQPAKPLVPVPGGALGILLAVLPFAFLCFWTSWRWLEKRTKPDVLARIDRYTALASADPATVRAGSSDRRTLMRAFAAPFQRIGDSFLGGSNYFRKVRSRAEQAAIAIKPSELFAAMVFAAAFGALLATVFGASPLLYAALVPSLGSSPNIWLILKARKRRRAFEDQLPDVLQAISSSLKAGHSFNQSINAMVKDSPQPTSDEFQRVMAEARLGMPLEDALQAMADRMGSADFEFAVTTVNIQRTVGGSLADILEMVGDTVRNRQQFRKKVKALTSMGQMSAYVLLGMPIFIACVITLMSPEYMAPMFTTTVGHFMLGAGAVSMLLGYVACMKVVSVKV
ncbi:MAG: putative type secretion system integral rane subunit [Thermoleophilia bacterium]|nr:putative type secretion system integral rane subunit [Thermoleophilia bacterium]